MFVKSSTDRKWSFYPENFNRDKFLNSWKMLKIKNILCRLNLSNWSLIRDLFSRWIDCLVFLYHLRLVLYDQNTKIFSLIRYKTEKSRKFLQESIDFHLSLVSSCCCSKLYKAKETTSGKIMRKLLIDMSPDRHNDQDERETTATEKSDVIRTLIFMKRFWRRFCRMTLNKHNNESFCRRHPK